MKPSAAIMKKWVSIYESDIGKLTDEQIEIACSVCGMCDYEELPDDAGILFWIIAKDFDCKKRMSVVILYCRPEKRGRYLRYIFKRLEEIAKSEGVVEIAIGHSVSGYKEDKFEKMLMRMGYTPGIYSKRV